LSSDTITFAEAAAKFSDDKDTKFNGGLLINPQTGNTRFEPDQVDPALFFTVDKLKVGEISQPVIMHMPGGKQAYRIIKLKARTEPHRANLKDDYQKIQEAALNDKQQEAITKWVSKKLTGTYVRVNEEYKDCKFEGFKIP
jgi:peptidyl-prolyl cis-trans isomerase SurA